MTTFLDGPAKGQTLALQRVPQLLRVVRDEETGTWDALNQPEDTAKPTEALYAYRMEGPWGWVHLHRGGGRGGFYGVATYRFIEPQPSEDDMRDNARWQKWFPP